jgi:hypothetical protein
MEGWQETKLIIFFQGIKIRLQKACSHSPEMLTQLMYHYVVAILESGWGQYIYNFGGGLIVQGLFQSTNLVLISKISLKYQNWKYYCLIYFAIKKLLLFGIGAKI